MKSIIAKHVNGKEFSSLKSPVLLEMIFDDLILLLRFIHEAEKSGSLSGPFFFTNQIDYLDKTWHHFILHTKFYSDFCDREFGEYLHHSPETVCDNEGEVDGQMVAIALEQQMNLLESKMGVDFVNRIFFLYPELLGV
ncbi:hypothetical protein [Bdellovibrio bacteriovorus]|uniref:Uncharacterized protein n=1 Tax=Bdellovibrio bacteriovorus TaxID=959 RepID=A0A1Z3NA08_BDEBC|nr:hypothetical protein [Bdellovibrio bacteriovorus]ASD64302.1 hypothetical protein B9G79_12360 [Bdellovibrio bacteriovorus]